MDFGKSTAQFTHALKYKHNSLNSGGGGEFKE